MCCQKKLNALQHKVAGVLYFFHFLFLIDIVDVDDENDDGDKRNNPDENNHVDSDKQ